METNEIMNNEEVMEATTEEVVKASSGKGLRLWPVSVWPYLRVL